jgi:hypothetical protein
MPRAKIVENMFTIRATAESLERFVPIIPEPTTTQTKVAVPMYSASHFLRIVITPNFSVLDSPIFRNESKAIAEMTLFAKCSPAIRSSRKTEKNTQSDVLFLWRRIGDSERLPFRMQEIDADLAFGSS